MYCSCVGTGMVLLCCSDDGGAQVAHFSRPHFNAPQAVLQAETASVSQKCLFLKDFAAAVRISTCKRIPLCLSIVSRACCSRCWLLPFSGWIGRRILRLPAPRHRQRVRLCCWTLRARTGAAGVSSSARRCSIPRNSRPMPRISSCPWRWIYRATTASALS